MIDECELERITAELIEAMGFSLVEMRVGRRRGTVNISVVLYKEGGITLDELTHAHRILRPRLELEAGANRLSLGITSPGTSRRIRDPKEYRIFTGRNIRLLVGEEWIYGRLEEYDGERLSIVIAGETRLFALDDIRGAELNSRLGEDNEC